MPRRVSAILLVLALAAAISSSANMDEIWQCPPVNPLNTSVDQVLGDWYLQELNTISSMDSVPLCSSIEITNLQASDSGNKSFSFLSYKVKNGTERLLSVNKTLDVSSDHPWLWVTRELGHLATIVAETDDRKLIGLATCTTRYRSIFEMFIISRDEYADPEQMQTIRDMIKAAGITPQEHLVVKNRTICELNS